MMDFTGKAKWDAWKANEGKSQDDAKKEYVEHLLSVLEKHAGEQIKASPPSPGLHHASI